MRKLDSSVMRLIRMVEAETGEAFGGYSLEGEAESL